MVAASNGHPLRALSLVVVCVCVGCSAREPAAEVPTLDAATVDDARAVEDTRAEDTAVAALDATSPCPPEMALVEGEYCPKAVYVCRRWLDPPGRFRRFRCAEYGPSVCASKSRMHLRFCIDRDEYTRPGESLPAVGFSWSSAGRTCASLGKRLCLESEWQFACEGEEMRPYPYGFVRDATACNIDRADIVGKTAPVDDREPAGSHPRCVSPFGVRDMSGNIEEWATIDGVTTKGERSTMKGAWWLPGRNHCRARTVGHGEIYSGPQIGVRCCKGF